MQLRRLIGSVLVFWLLSCISVIPQGAAAPRVAPLRLPVSAADSGIDVVVVLDDSGSMSGECQDCVASDPNNLRYSAAKLLLQLLDNDDRIAFVRFGDSARSIGGVLQQAGTLAERGRIAANVVPPSAGAYDKNTHIDKGVVFAHDILAKRGTTTRPGFILLLTDGKPSGRDPNSQGREIQQIQSDMKARNIQVLPIRLCSQNKNEKDPCNIDFLSANFDFATPVQSAEELVRTFVSMYQVMKPGAQVVERGSDGALSMNFRTPHGVRWVKVVGTAQNLSPMSQSSGGARAGQKVPIDPNVSLDYYDFSSNMATAQGSWTAGGTFAVVRTDTTMLMRFPPGNTEYTRTRFVSKDKLQLATFTVTGPGAAEPLLIGTGNTADTIPNDAGRVALLPTGNQTVKIQLGEDQRPLQLRDTYDIRLLDQAPTITLRIDACQPETPCTVVSRYSSVANLSNISAELFVRNDQKQWQAPIPMECTTEQCVGSFIPQAGDAYGIYVLSSAVWNGKTRFGSVAQDVLETKSQMTVTGLATPLDLMNAPNEGWPIKVSSPSTENLGVLSAQLNLSDINGALVPGVQAVIEGVAPITGRGEYSGTLKITGVRDLGPGQYTGELVWMISNPNDKVSVPASVAIRSSRSAPTVKLAIDTIRFMVPSVTLPVSSTVEVPLSFHDRQRFIISGAEVVSHDCPANQLTASVSMRGETAAVVTLHTDTAIPTFSSCSGQVRLTTADRTAIIEPAIIDFDVVMPTADWQIIGGVAHDETTPDITFDNGDSFWGSTYRATVLIQLATYQPLRYSSGIITDTVGNIFAVALAEPELTRDSEGDTTGRLQRVPVTISRTCGGWNCLPVWGTDGSTAKLTFFADDITDVAFAKTVPVNIRSRAWYDTHRPFWSSPLKVLVGVILLLLVLQVVRVRSSAPDESTEGTSEVITTTPLPITKRQMTPWSGKANGSSAGSGVTGKIGVPQPRRGDTTRLGTSSRPASVRPSLGTGQSSTSQTGKLGTKSPTQSKLPPTLRKK